ncbi:MAG: DUF4347 domain-containing protein [Acidobacteriota bacterium]
MEINVVDLGDSYFVKLGMQLRALNQPVIDMTPGKDGVQRMVSEIMKIAKPASITVLRIYAHGNSGVINVAGGEYDASADLSAISVRNYPKIENILRSLNTYFKRPARVELVGCLVALDSNKQVTKNSDGENLITNLANLWQVDVLASGNPNELPIAGLKFVGLVVKASPGGGLSATAPTEISRVR